MLGQIAWRGFSLVYGLFNLVTFTLVAVLRDGALTKRPSKEEKTEFSVAQKRYWSLEREPLPGFAHAFFTTRTGLRFHYILNNKAETASVKNVAVFIHGFPDSVFLWRHILTSLTLESYALIAVDLPGYGGSGNLPKYGPNEILEAISEFILEARERYLKEGAKMVIVGHDWGGIVTSRLASEANQLADRFVVASAIIPQHAHANAVTKAASAKQMLHTYLRNPLRVSLLKNAYSTLTPVLSQIGRSFYIFIFNLPRPLSTWWATFGNYWLLKLLHNVAAGLLNPNGSWKGKLNDKQVADFLAMSSGPSLANIEDSKGRYPDEAKKRVRDHGLSEKIRIYREHLLLNPWEKSLETVVELSELPASVSRSGSGGSGAGFLDDGPPGALKAPTTLVYGRYDLGFERRLALEGIGDYMTKGSQVVLVEGAGHWLPYEGFGSKVLEDVVRWSLGDEHNTLKGDLNGVDRIKFLVEK